jgi:cholesterol 7-desaturase
MGWKSLVFTMVALVVSVVVAATTGVMTDGSSSLVTHHMIAHGKHLVHLATLSLHRTMKLPVPTLLCMSAAIVSGIVVLVWLGKHLFQPFERHFTLKDVEGSDELSGMRGGVGARSRKAGALPPPYPNGWFKILESRDLTVGQVKSVQFLGQHLVAFRGQSGNVSVLDAYCPHMGANLGAGGRVVGDSIACPFHGWEFNGSDGVCTAIPYSSKAVPKNARTRAWHVSEANKQIYLWFDAEDREPTWQVQKTEIDGSYRYHGSTSHEIKAHIQVCCAK